MINFIMESSGVIALVRHDDIAASKLLVSVGGLVNLASLVVDNTQGSVGYCRQRIGHLLRVRQLKTIGLERWLMSWSV